MYKICDKKCDKIVYINGEVFNKDKNNICRNVHILETYKEFFKRIRENNNYDFSDKFKKKI